MEIEKMNQSKIYQLDFWQTEEESQIESMNKRIDAIHESSNKVRKAMFGRHGNLEKRIIDLEEKYEILVKNICQGRRNG